MIVNIDFPKTANLFSKTFTAKTYCPFFRGKYENRGKFSTSFPNKVLTKIAE